MNKHKQANNRPTVCVRGWWVVGGGGDHHLYRFCAAIIFAHTLFYCCHCHIQYDYMGIGGYVNYY